MARVYAGEIKDGIGQLVELGRSVSVISKAVHNKDFKRNTDELKAKLATASNVTPDTIDLFPLKNVLVSTGWNANEDVFLPMEVYQGRFTNVDKPINENHVANKIIGHTLASYPVDRAGLVMADTLDETQIPQAFDLINEDVIYRFLQTDEEERIGKIIAEIEAGDWSVSMEAIFNNFDYAIQDTDGSNKVVSRTESTSFLSKHLKAYGGNGVYNGSKIGRALKNLFFSGKAITQNPANKRSVILNDFTKSSVTQIENIKGNKMEEELKKLKADFEALQTKLVAKEAELLNANTALTAKVGEFGQLNTTHETLRKEFEGVNVKLTETQAQLTALNTKFTEIEKAKIVAVRIEQIVAKGYDKTEAEVQVTKFVNLSDEQWNAFVDMVKAKEIVAPVVPVVPVVAQVVASIKPVEQTGQLEKLEPVVEVPAVVVAAADASNNEADQVGELISKLLKSDRTSVTVKK